MLFVFFSAYNLLMLNKADICAKGLGAEGEVYSVTLVARTSPEGSLTEKCRLSFGENLIV